MQRQRNPLVKLGLATLLAAGVIMGSLGQAPAQAQDCPSQYTTWGGWTCTFVSETCDENGCCCHYTSGAPRPVCPDYCV